MSASAIILAAGTSSRMAGANKLLLPLWSTTSVRLVAENLLKAGVQQVIAVTGYQGKKVQEILEGLPLTVAHNQAYEQGLTTSIQAGVSVATGSGYMFCLSDMPFVSSEEYKSILAFFEEKKQMDAPICVPVYDGQPGNPVVFSSAYRQQILQNTQMNGCKNIAQANSTHVYHLAMKTPGVITDMDTPEDYNRILALQQTGEQL